MRAKSAWVGCSGRCDEAARPSSGPSGPHLTLPDTHRRDRIAPRQRSGATCPSFAHAFVRALVGVVEIYAFTGAPAFFSAMLSTRGKRLGDHAAGTYVVRERVRLQLAPPAAMPHHLMSWARLADMATLPTGLALAVRQYLGRASMLDPQTQHELGSRLAADVVTCVAPPPRGTTHHDLQAAVIASRRECDSARLSREAAMRDRLTGEL